MFSEHCSLLDGTDVRARECSLLDYANIRDCVFTLRWRRYLGVSVHFQMAQMLEYRASGRGFFSIVNRDLVGKDN